MLLAYEKGGFNGDIAAILRPIQRGMLPFVGFDVPKPEIVSSQVRRNDEQRREALHAWAARLRTISEEKLIEVGIC